MVARMGLLCLIPLLIGFPSSSFATVLVDHSLADLVYLAVKDDAGSGVVVARTGHSWTQWDEGRRFPYTYTEFALEKEVAAKGALPSRFVIRQFGGRLDGVEVRVHGQPTFRENEKTLLFLRRQGEDLQPVGMSQGKFSIYLDHKSGQERAVSVHDPQTLFVAVGKTGAGQPQPKVEAPQNLSTLIDQIQTIARNFDEAGR